MSKVVKKFEKRPLAHILESNGAYFYIDSDFTTDHGLETMIFSIKDLEKMLKFDKKAVDWSGIYEKRHETLKEMQDFHDFAINNLENVLNRRRLFSSQP